MDILHTLPVPKVMIVGSVPESGSRYCATSCAVHILSAGLVHALANQYGHLKTARHDTTQALLLDPYEESSKHCFH
jgi:hypothetical protein